MVTDRVPVLRLSTLQRQEADLYGQAQTSLSPKSSTSQLSSGFTLAPAPGLLMFCVWGKQFTAALIQMHRHCPVSDGAVAFRT